MSKQKNRFMVGWSGNGQTVYGKDEIGAPKYADPMTRNQAEKMAARIYRNRMKRSPRRVLVYKLVPVEEERR